MTPFDTDINSGEVQRKVSTGKKSVVVARIRRYLLLVRAHVD